MEVLLYIEALGVICDVGGDADESSWIAVFIKLVGDVAAVPTLIQMSIL
jgi:hypothetical protein